jgi:L-iditol 2-dehydrogenase
VYDCVGSRSSIAQALGFAATRGRIVLLGCAAQIPRLDLTFLWARELDVKGFVGYGRELWRDGESHTFEVTMRLLIESAASVERMITHVFPLSQYRDALRATANRKKSRSVKVLLDPSG